MQISNIQFLSISAEDSMKMESSAFLHSDFRASVLPADTDLLSNEELIKSDELLAYTLWATDMPQSVPQEALVCVGDAVAAEEIISIAGLAAFNTSDSISFFGNGDDQSPDTRFSVTVPADADCGMVIDAELAATFGITVIGMEFPVNHGLKFVSPMSRLDWRIRRERLNAGRVICLLKQQLNL